MQTKRHQPKNTFSADVFVLIIGSFSRSENERNAPDSRKGDYCVDDSCKNCGLTAAEPSDGIEFEKTDPAPVQRTDNDENKR